MTTPSMYEFLVPTANRMLGNLSALLDKAAAHAEAKKFDPANLMTARLAPDMHPFTRQVQIACDQAKGAAARLSGAEPPSYPDVEATIPELKARIAKTLEYVNSVDPVAFAGSEDRTVTLKSPKGELQFSGIDYLRGFMLPNFYFHISMAYALLRHNGVEIGKFDYIGRP
ncbi:hypothetical protein ACS15_2411 [Ralstonia insidiosa]|uniref:DUF1993 domain-containing protein n=1 Tax=Ralstonia insidiosa TaxID=190721 RepID=A0AAC9BLN1_9RALS|nr:MULTISPECIES: DUF1993 family protein [Ralstonia]ANH74793.1 hypothetical protein ACS15_2411 [Ralstonia insidiosa]MBY4704787.1 DUF1993 family protein [Ralstonia insidiosa]GAQ30313.1 hypothetical protein SAMD00023378_3996 [Ralstonia sp. NT80]